MNQTDYFSSEVFHRLYKDALLITYYIESPIEEKLMSNGTTFRIKVTARDFEASESYGWVDGRWRSLYVYVELGQERPYLPEPKDDPKTDYKIFTGCSAYFADNQEKLDNGDYDSDELPDLTVIIYC